MTPADRLDPDVAAAIAAIPFAGVNAGNLRALRVRFELPAPDLVERTEHVAPGDPPLSVRVHRAKQHDGVLPCVYAMHGGGYVIGNNTMDDAFFAECCPKLGFVGVSVEYRLAPETPYPGPLDDCTRGLQWTIDHADELGIDPRRIGVMGVSAGGGLAAALALRTRDRGEIELAFQLLDQPMLDDRQVTPSSREDRLPVWSRESNEFGWKAYLGELYGTDEIPPTAAPARATDLSGLPPTLICVGAVDGFRDEDVDYALRLNQAGVPTELHVYPGGCHGFNLLAGDAPVSKQCRRDIEVWLARQLRASEPARQSGS